MNVTLDVYTRIFSNILQHSEHDNPGTPSLLDQLPEEKRPEVKSRLMKLKHKMETVKSRLGHLGHNKEDVLSKLNEIKVGVTCLSVSLNKQHSG